MLKKTLTLIAILFVGLMAGILGLASLQPDSFRVERSASINAPASVIFPFINDLQRWSAWSPYEKIDPAMKRTFSGAASGTGAVYAWDGNNDVGAGRMEIIAETPPSQLSIQLDFLRPMEGRNQVEFTLNEAGGVTEVTWSIQGPMPFLSKIMCLFFDMDKMIGKDYEAGLAALKKVSEAGA